MKLLQVVAFCAISASAVFCASQAKEPEKPAPKYLVIARHRVLNPNVSTAAFCSTPGCNNVYGWGYVYVPFPTLQQALAYMNGQDLTVHAAFDNDAAFLPMDISDPKLFELKPVPVKVKEKKESIPQPPIEKTHTVYSEVK